MDVETDSTIPRYVISFDDVPQWARLVNLFADRCYKQLGDRLVSVIALSREDEQLYESNVLVVVRDDGKDVTEKIIQAKWMAEEDAGVKENLSINFLTCTPKEKVFSSAFEREGFHVK
nr:hypothetical protein [Candidatus Freyarchaeota archaeon]